MMTFKTLNNLRHDIDTLFSVIYIHKVVYEHV